MKRILLSAFIAVLAIQTQAAVVDTCSLPSALELPSGRKVENVKQWEEYGRQEWLEIATREQFGYLPNVKFKTKYELVESSTEALDGKAIRKQVRATFSVDTMKRSVDMLMYIPKGEIKGTFVYMNFQGNFTLTYDKEVPAFKWYVNTEFARRFGGDPEQYRGSRSFRLPLDLIIGSGYAVITSQYNQYYYDSYPDKTLGYKGSVCEMLFNKDNSIPDEHRGQAIATWAWGFSRMMDYVMKDKDFKSKKAIAIGHSRLGKTALWAGINDKRFDIVVPNNSGSLGAAVARCKTGETLARTVTVRPHWFAKYINKYIPCRWEIPFDAHILIGLVAPRAVYVASSSEDVGAAPAFEYSAIYNAKEVYGTLYGFETLPQEKMIGIGEKVHLPKMGFHLRPGTHNILPYDWERHIQFADKVLGYENK